MKGLADLIDSDMEDSPNFIDENSILSSATDATDIATGAPKKRAKKRNKVTMPKPKSRVAKTSPKQPARSKKTTEPKRKALEGVVNEQIQSEQFEDQQSEDDAGKNMPQKKARGRVGVKSKSAKQGDQVDGGMEVDQTPAVARSSHAAVKSKNPVTKVTKTTVSAVKMHASAEEVDPVVKESQQIRVDAESEIEDALEVPPPKPMPAYRARAGSAIRQTSTTRRRAGSASDTERGDPNLRRKLGDITRKFENVDLKYRNLKEVGIVEANANMDKLRKQCEATTQASNELIASLKKELAIHAPLAQEARVLKKQVQKYESESVELRKTAAELSTSLQTAQNEIKALQAKVAAARTGPPVEHHVERYPGSASKARNGQSLGMEAAQRAQMKEDLYSDLTGLIVRSARKTQEGDTYDCIQTSKNGTLHFKLFMDAEDAKTTSFEETEFLYVPYLDANRDREMIEMLPTYLTEEITFARQNAAKFYGRVVDSLTKKRTDE